MLRRPKARTATAALLFLLAISSAQARYAVLSRHGYWTMFGGADTNLGEVCGLLIEGTGPSGYQKFFRIMQSRTQSKRPTSYALAGC
jgi:hypothetical protein